MSGPLSVSTDRRILMMTERLTEAMPFARALLDRLNSYAKWAALLTEDEQTVLRRLMDKGEVIPLLEQAREVQALVTEISDEFS